MPDTFKHSVEKVGMGQPNEATCWLACYRMLFSYLQRPIGDIQKKLEAARVDYSYATNHGLSDTDYASAAKALQLQAWPGSRFNAEPGLLDFGLSDGAEAFLKELQLGPLWVSRKAGKDSYHIVLAVGYFDGDGLFNNPFPGPNSAIEQRLTANLFVRNITGATGSVQAWRYRVE
jgi:hypothetical protein